MTPTSRQPRGIPSGGQFAATARPAAATSLHAENPDHVGPGTPAGVALMLKEDQPTPVRAAAARTIYPGVGAVASQDSSPLVRSLALAAWDLPDADRARLEGDPEVQKVMSFIRQ